MLLEKGRMTVRPVPLPCPLCFTLHMMLFLLFKLILIILHEQVMILRNGIYMKGKPIYNYMLQEQLLFGIKHEQIILQRHNGPQKNIQLRMTEI